MKLILKIIFLNDFISPKKFQWNLNFLFHLFHFNTKFFKWNFLFFVYQKTILYDAIEKENLEIINLLLSHPTIDVNVYAIILNQIIFFSL